MFGIGFLEIVVIMIVALLVFGPDRVPEMTKQAASFVRDLRKMVANARRDISVSAKDLGIDEEDLRTLRQLRNPQAFVRDQVLNGLELDDLVDEPAQEKRSSNGGTTARRTPSPGTPAADASTSGEPATPARADLPYDPDTT